MNRNRLILIGILALAIAAWVTVAAYRSLSNAMGSMKRASMPVVVAADTLPTGKLLGAGDLRLAHLPANDIPAGTFQDVSEVLGRGVIAPMTKNEPILQTKIAGKEAGGGLPAIIPAGKRAVSVKVNDVVSVAGFVVPGTHVDVLLTGNPERNNDPRNVSTTTVLQNIPVLAAGTKLERNPQGQPQSVPVITLMVSPDEAQKLTLAASEGRIQLALRNPMDGEVKRPPVLRNGELYQSGLPLVVAPKVTPRPKVAAVAPPPPAPYVVEMIRGEKRDSAKF